MAGKIKPLKKSTKGSFTRMARKAGRSVQAEASAVLRPGSGASPAAKKKANFARNAAKWRKK